MNGLNRLLASALEYWEAGDFTRAGISYQIASHFSEMACIKAALDVLQPPKAAAARTGTCLKVPFYGNADFFCGLCAKIIAQLPDGADYAVESDEFDEKAISFGIPENGIREWLEKSGLLDEHFFRQQYAPESSCIEDFYAHFPDRRLSQWLHFEKRKSSAPVPSSWQRSKAKVSIICPVFNNYEYLDECAYSLLDQTLEDIEIIFVNDGSTDPRIYDRLAFFKRLDGRARVINKTNSGYGHSMNCGIMAANGEYIGIVESDDYVSPHMFRTLYDKSAGSRDIIKSHVMYFTGPRENRAFTRRKIAFPPYGDDFAAERLDEYFRGVLINPSGIFRTDFIRGNELFFNPTPGASYQDIGFFLKTAFNASAISIVNEHLYNVRRDNEASSVFAKGNMQAPVREYAELEKYLDQNPEMKKKFLDYFLLKKSRSYRFTAGRLDQELKPEFMRIFAAEWKGAKLRRALFSKDELDWLEENIEPLLYGEDK